MPQEYIAIIIFIGAICFSVYSIIKYLIKFKASQGSACEGDCNCKPEKGKRPHLEVVQRKPDNYKQVSLK